MPENTNKSALLGLGIGAATLGVAAYYLYKKNNSNSDTTEQAEELLYSASGGGAVTSDTGNTSIADIIGKVFDSLPTGNTTEVTPVTDLIGEEITIPKVTTGNTDTGNTTTGENTASYPEIYVYGGKAGVAIENVNYNNPSDENADNVQNTASKTSYTDLENYYLNNYGITREDYLKLYDDYASTATTASHAVEHFGTMETRFQNWLLSQKENASSSSDNWLVDSDYAKAFERGTEYLTESYDTGTSSSWYDKTDSKGNVTTGASTKSSKNKYTYSGNAAAQDTGTYNTGNTANTGTTTKTTETKTNTGTTTTTGNDTKTTTNDTSSSSGGTTITIGNTIGTFFNTGVNIIKGLFNVK